MEIERIKTPDSSNLAEFAFDPETQTLEVAFKSGFVYEYFDVPPSIFESLKEAHSKGSYLHKHIKGHFIYGVKK